MDKKTREKLEKVSIQVMEHSGYKASLMAAKRLPDDGTIHPLPLGMPISTIPIHCLPGVPKSWLRKAGSYVVPVDSEMGLWFDWTMNNPHNVAIVPSVKGMNPITGQKLESMAMQQYRDKCPVHNIDLAHERYCEKCGYKWPAQNYISYADGRTLWLDGFRQSDGTVRQFFFSEDDKRDIASLVIGKKNTVPAFGFAFFKSKKERLERPLVTRGVFGTVGADELVSVDEAWSHDVDWDYRVNKITSTTPHHLYTSQLGSGGGGMSAEPSVQVTNSTSTSSVSSSSSELRMKGAVDRSVNEVSSGISTSKPTKLGSTASLLKDESKAFSVKKKAKEKTVSVGAGAAIDQDLGVDTMALEDWRKKESAVIVLYFVFAEQLEEIVKNGGVKEIEGKKAGYLEKLPVG